MYDGVMGIGMLFLMLDVLTGASRFRNAWQSILEEWGVGPAQGILRNRKRLDSWVRVQPTAFSYPLSALFFGVHASAHGNSDALEPLLAASLEYTGIGLKRAPRCDFLSGAAGVIQALLVAHRAFGVPAILNTARAYGDQLISRSIAAPVGIGWPSDSTNLPDFMGGFSHGASGIAWVLADLAHATGDDRYLASAREGLDYDRTLYSASRPSWIDVRTPTEAGTASQWCHGPPGIALSRTLLAASLDDSFLREEAVEGARACLIGESRSDCLCHGTLGNLDIFMTITADSTDAELKAAGLAFSSRIWQDARNRGFWRSGVPGHDVGLRGLFMGIAGVAYGLLRVAAPGRVPSVLFLEGPKSPMKSLEDA
ncbi:MAG: lanthionine synthetase LanC family protein [Thermoanaerobaculia bacterium]